MHFHKWNLVQDTGKHKYLECLKCGKRKIKVVYKYRGYQPIDKNWLQ